jgi:hypothetical protein
MMCAFEPRDDMRKSSPKAKPTMAPKGAAADQASDGDRHRRIAEIAYSLGARRGFAGGCDEAREDWLEAERVVDEGEVGSSR